MATSLQVHIDREAKASLATQIHADIREAIFAGRIKTGARLPSWRDLAAQLGVARGTVRVAYERLIDEQLIVGLGAAGTRVAEYRPAPKKLRKSVERLPLPELYHDFEATPLAFQMGVPAQDEFPYKLWSRVMVRSARLAAAAPVSYPDPRGHPELRREIAAYLAIARGIRCSPAQVLVTAGYSGALGLALRVLHAEGKTAWLEDPAFPLTRAALQSCGVKIVAVPVDAAGIDVAAGVRRAPRAAFAVVTPGQQAPLGMTMSLSRRMALLGWARKTGAWIIEDDYLGELQLKARAAPALASLDDEGRVLHAGTFSKTISPALRLGFLVVPEALAARFGDAAGCLAPAPTAAIQHAVAQFIAQGHFLRHLRRMKRLYATRRETLANHLRQIAKDRFAVHADGGLSVRIELPDASNDVAIATRSLPFGLSPVPLSPWYDAPQRRSGLLLGVTNLSSRHVAANCTRLIELIELME